MIYLIDDKKHRQHKDFGWNDERFAQYADFIKPLYSIEDIIEIGENLYNEGNIILYHESFLDFSNDRQKALEQRWKLQNIAETKPDISIVFFSGSQGSRSLIGNIAHTPVSILYQNLEIAVKQHVKGSIELQYLLFGNKPQIEEELLTKLNQANKVIEEDCAKLNGNNLFVRPISNFIQNAINGASEGKLFNDTSDKRFSDKVKEWLSETEYDNIFLPLCFGPTLSDYNGLRLATHIRCTLTKNQLKKIFIYSAVELDYLIDHEYFNILKTKNVVLVPYSKKAFELAANKNTEPLKPEELPTEIKKLNLEPPLNYMDSHSIANEWAIYQWAKTIGCDETDELNKIFQNVQANLYFKYLRTINPISVLEKISSDELRIDLQSKPKVLLIDDEGDIGWNEIFAHLLYDINEIDIDYLSDDIKNKSQDEIIAISIEKIFNDNIDIVILDFRLNFSDFKNQSSEQITSVKLLKEIKERNPGVQVIAFSATNKIWNFKYLESEGANGFISKGDPYNSDKQFIKRSIKHLIQSILECSHLVFLKGFYNEQYDISKDLIPRRKAKNPKPLPKDFIDEALKWLKLSNDILSTGYLNEAKIVSSFLFKFSVLENISNRVIDTDNPILVGKNDKGINKYKFQFRLSEKWLRNFIEDEINKGYYRKTNRVYESSRNIPWVIKILNTIDFITNESLNQDDLTKLVKKRNDFIHANPTTGDKVSISVNDLKFLNYIITLGLKNIV